MSGYDFPVDFPGVEVSPFGASSSRYESMIISAVPMGYGAARKVTAPTYLDSQ